MAQSLTELLRESEAGNASAFDRLVPLVYEELRAIAHAQLRRERPGHTLSTTALVHEAYLRMVDQRSSGWKERAQFFALAARAMRRVLVDYARRRGAEKRGAGLPIVSLSDEVLGAAVEDQGELVLAVDEALAELATLDERQSRVVEYRFFGGLTEEEVGQLLGVTARTVRNDWVKAKGWLLRRLTADRTA